MSSADDWLPTACTVGSAAVSVWYMGPAVLGLVLAMVLSLPLYHRTLGRRLPEPERFVPLYLTAVAWQFVHFVEEYATGFQHRLPELLGTTAWDDARFVTFNMVFYAAFVLAAVAMLRGIRWPTWFACFFLIAMLLNGVGHVAATVWSGGYFPGLWTAPVCFAFGLVLLRRLVAPAAPDPTALT